MSAAMQTDGSSSTGPRNRSTHSAAVARRGGGGEGGGGARVSVDEAVGAAQSAFELFLDCLASPEPDPHLLSTVARSVVCVCVCVSVSVFALTPVSACTIFGMT